MIRVNITSGVRLVSLEKESESEEDRRRKRHDNYWHNKFSGISAAMGFAQGLLVGWGLEDHARDIVEGMNSSKLFEGAYSNIVPQNHDEMIDKIDLENGVAMQITAEYVDRWMMYKKMCDAGWGNGQVRNQTQQ